ncbi:ribonuclease H-like domain-containing protein [Tanacetum coccineum]
MSGPTPNPNSPSPSSHTHLTTPFAIIPTHAATDLTTNTHHMVTRVKVGISKPLARMNCHATTTSPIPRSHLHALRDPHWHKDMVDEYNALIYNGAWGSDIAYLLLYVDDIVLTALLQRIITLLHSEFAMTDLGSLTYFLGISAQRSNIVILVTPMDTEFKLGSDGDPLICLYMHDPRDSHFHALKSILCYVCGTIDHDLQLHVSSTSQLTTFTNADWAGFPVIRKSTSRYSEAAWIRNLLLELHALLTTATLVYCDNVRVLHVPSRFHNIRLGDNKDALTRDDKLLIPDGKYYLVDGGLPHRITLIAPYRGVRYHLKEYSSRAPQNPQELFNLWHSSLRNSIERAFDVDRNKELEDEVIHEMLDASHDKEPNRARDTDNRGEQIRNLITNNMWSDYIVFEYLLSFSL